MNSKSKMRKILKPMLISLVLVLATSIGFFISLTQSIEIDNSYADITGVSGEVINLTCEHNHYYKLNNEVLYDYFVDKDGDSTLKNAYVYDSQYEYINEKGETVSSFYVIKSDTSVSKRFSSGSARFNLTSEMASLADKGLLYVQARAGVITLAEKNNSNVTIQVSQGDQVNNVTSNYSEKGINVEQWISSDYIKVNTNDLIEFSFTSVEKGSMINPCEFILLEPKLVFKTVINTISFSEDSGKTHPGDIIELDAQNDVTKLAGDEYMKYVRSIHKINYEIVEGNGYAEIIDGYLYVDEKCPTTTIKIKASSKKDSKNSEVVECYKEYSVDTQTYKVITSTDFKNPARIIGAGEYQAGTTVCLNVPTINDGFNFVSWEIGASIYKEKKIEIEIEEDITVKCNFIKNIYIKEVKVSDKVYDGTDNASVQYILEGVESDHDVKVEGLTTKFITANVGNNSITYGEDDIAVLTGTNKDIYNLVGNTKIQASATIKPLKVKITPEDCEKTYGDDDPTIKYKYEEEEEESSSETTIEYFEDLNIEFIGELDRIAGENVGSYKIGLGTLPEKNTNYSFKLSSEYKYLTIKQKTVEINEIKLKEKVYDRTVTAEIDTVSLKNVKENDDLKIQLEIEFNDCKAGYQSIKIKDSKLIGESSGNYKIDLSGYAYPSIFEIKTKDLTITAKEGSSVFGDEIILLKDVEGLIEGDNLEGCLSITGKDVGEYEIQSNLSNSNYKIEFNSAIYKIEKRNVKVIVDSLSKIYGEQDPTSLKYTVENDIAGEKITGSLTRVAGEDVGEYLILIGTLNNDNYNLILSDSKFIINKKGVNININITDKVYDGTNNVEYTYEIEDLENDDQIEFSASLKYIQVDASENNIKINVENPKYSGESAKNYDIKNNFDNLYGKIKRKDVEITIDKQEVYYGDNEKTLTYSADGLIGSEKLIGELKREEGKSVGEYRISLNTINNENNKNYNISQKNVAYYVIAPAEITIQILSYEKTYGEADPEFKFTVKEKLKYDDKIENIISGKLEREEGNVSGNYKISEGTLTTNNNYKISNVENGTLTILKKKAKIYAVGCEKTYGDDDPKFKYTSEDLISEDKLSIQLIRISGDNVGDYKITYESLNDQRYDLTFVEAVLTIKPKDIVVKIDDKIKTYGDKDPKFTISLCNGENLVVGDEIENLEKGSLTREDGESVRKYTISKGTYNLGKNYNLSFTNGELTISPCEIEITADDINKIYGDKEKTLTYKITKGSLKNNDKIIGILKRDSGDNVGKYEIEQGNLTIDNINNYSLSFVSGEYTVEKRKITISADEKTKTYGEVDPELTYTVSEGKIIDRDSLNGTLSREKKSTLINEKAYEGTGKYLISSTLQNENYDITFISNYLIIQRKEITVTAENKTKTYGEDDPELTYVYDTEKVIEGDSISGGLSRNEGENAGAYEIKSNLTLGKNYKINFIKGILTIQPIALKIKTYDYEKVYGEANPTFDYKIISGELINKDKLNGEVTREEGETVGKYKLVSGFENINYTVELTENYLTINQKNAYLDVNAQDKVYDGTNIAVIKNPVITGLIDKTVKLLYDKEKCAYFESSDIGNNLRVTLYDISLTGDKSENYKLNYPTNLFANITFNQLSDENEIVKLDTDSNTSLNLGTKINVDFLKDESVDEIVDTSKEVISIYRIGLEEDNKEKDLSESIDISLKVDEDYNNKSNYYVYRKEDNGEFTFISSNYKDGYLEITTDKLGEFVILSDSENWIDIAAYVSIGVIGLFIIIISIKSVRLKTKRKKFARYF